MRDRDERLHETQAIRTRGWRFWRTSLRARLVSYFLLLSFFILLPAVVLAFLGMRHALRRTVYEQLGVVAELEKDQLTLWLRGRRKSVEVLASSPTLLEGAHLLLADGFSAADRASAHARMSEYFGSTLEIDDSLKEILILSAQGGRIAVSTKPERQDEYRVRDRYFTEGLLGTHLEGVYPSPVSFEPTFTISTPIRSRDAVLGVLAVHLDLLVLDRIVGRRAELGVRGESYLVDRYGEFVSGTRFGREAPLRGVHTEGIDAVLQGQEGWALYENYLGDPVIGAYRWIEDLGLALLVEIPQNEAFAPARTIASRVLVLGGILVLVLSVGTTLVAHQIAEPILGITEAAVRVRRGDLATKAPVKTNDEIGTLAETFNDMTTQLHLLLEELEAKNAELERFTYTVSHDLKSPLVTIAGFLPLLRADCAAGDPEKVDADLAHIRSAVEKMSGDLEGLLELAQVGMVANPRENCSLESLVRESLESVHGEIDAQGVEVIVDSDLPWIRADAARIREALTNLISNAAKFMGDTNQPRLEIGATLDNGEVRCQLRDNGVGIDEANQEKIFGLFERLDNEPSGSGIGLAVVRRVVEVHGGRVWVESAGRGHGSTFYLTLPMAIEDSD